VRRRAQLGFDFNSQKMLRSVGPAHQSSTTLFEVPIDEAIRVERNTVVAAGAGSGKTHSMVSMAVHALCGARANAGQIVPSELVLLTFTEKAAAELKHRLYDRVNRLAEQVDPDEELQRSFFKVGKAYPDRSFFSNLRLDLGAAHIETIHAYCLQILRRASPQEIEILTERRTRQLVRESLETAVFSSLEKEDPDVKNLVVDFGFGGEGEFGLVTALVPVFTRLQEEGVRAKEVVISQEPQCRDAFDKALSAMHWASKQSLAKLSKERAKLLEFHSIASRVTFENVEELLPSLAASLGRSREAALSELRVFVREPERGANEAHLFLGSLKASVLAAPMERAVRRLLQMAQESYSVALSERNQFDFASVLSRAKESLISDLPLRAALHKEIKLLLIDEFQDTNRMQFEIALLLSEKRMGAPRAIDVTDISKSIAALPLEGSTLAIVGDRKQAIYEFRGADVQVFSSAQTKILAEQGQIAVLSNSRRSTPRLLTALNALSSRVLGRERYVGNTLFPFEIVFDQRTDALRAVRDDVDVVPIVKLSSQATDEPADAFEKRRRDANAIAHYLGWALSKDHFEVTTRQAQTRRLRGSDVALLFQRLTHVEVYRQALVRAGLKHRVIKGRGFYGAQEILDVASALSVLVDQSNTNAKAAVFRSPFVGLSDSSLIEAVQIQRIDQSGVLALKTLDVDERSRFLAFAQHFQMLTQRAGVLTLSELVAQLVDSTRFRIRVGASPFGDQALSNLDKLIHFARSEETKGTSLGAFARQLELLAETEPKAEQGEVISQSDEDAIVLCTVHQAKGLEWPWVVLPDLEASVAGQSGLIRFDNDLGLGVRLPIDDFAFESPRAAGMAHKRQRQTEAERARLLYVALTRARDRVVLGLTASKARNGTWAHALKIDHLSAFEFETVNVSELVLEKQNQSSSSSEPTREPPDIESLLRRVTAPLPLPKRITMTVDALNDLQLCTARYALKNLHQLECTDRLSNTAKYAPDKLNALARASFDVGEAGAFYQWNFALNVSNATLSVFLKGTVDVIFVQKSKVVALVFTAAPSPFIDWQLKLQLLLLALAKRFPNATLIEIGTLDPSGHAQLLKVVPSATEVESHVLQLAEQIVQGPLDMAPRPAHRCRSLECAFLRRCHPN
jgi:ATP-dependent helicase/nuclease subunit A